MPRIACRWPGGMTLALPRDGLPPQTVLVAGPQGDPSLLPRTSGLPPRSREAATLLQRRVADALARMRDTAADAFGPRDYGVTDVDGTFWAAWLAQNQALDVVRLRIVFEV